MKYVGEPLTAGMAERGGELIVERHGIKLLRGPYTAKPFVLLDFWKRSGGDGRDFNVIKLMEVAVNQNRKRRR